MGRTYVTNLEVFSCSDSVTRPSDTTTYTAGDAWTDSASAPAVGTGDLQLAVATHNGGAGVILDAYLLDNEAPTLKLQAEVWLFSSAHTLDNDNVAFAPTDAELLNLVAILPFSGFFVGTASGNGALPTDRRNIPFRTAVADTKLYGYIVVRDGYVPVASEKLTLVLWVQRN